MNKIFLSGNLTRDPEIKTYKGDVTTAKSSIAVKRNFSKNGETDFFNVTAFGKTAEFMSKYFSKGRRAVIEGRLQASSYADKDGNKKSSVDVIIENIEFGDSKKTNADDDGKPEEISDSDLPF